MRKNVLLLLFAVIVIHSQIRSNTVSEENAKTIALNFFKVTAPNPANTPLTATLNYTRKENNNIVVFYVFDINPVKGFVIVSADDNISPVIGYSTESNFNANAPRIGINDWMNHAAVKIRYAIQQHVQADTRISGLWSAYRHGYNPMVERNITVNPLVSTTWNQEPYYNALCPFNSADNEICVTGCVATAMAQILKFWNYPAEGVGSYSYDDAPPNFSYNYGMQSANFAATTYNWGNMPVALSGNNSDVATLMYQCGVSVAMDYGDDNEGGSGAWVLQAETGDTSSPCAQYSYVHYFSYNPNSIQGVFQSDYSAAVWISLIENELNSGRPVQYEGYETNGEGHTWVCDGYDANNLLHMNWGWGGADDGYFDVSNLSVSGYVFNTGDAALIGIEPPSPVNVSVVASSNPICAGSNAMLTAQGPTSATYTWVPTTGLSCSTCASTMVTADSNAIYTVTVDSAGITASAIVVISVPSQASAGFTVNNLAATCSVPVNISFTNSSANSTNYLWDFGDGTTGTDMNPVHTYASYGNYTVKLIASNSCNADSVIQNQVVHINDEAPVTAGESICAGQTAILTATGSGAISWYDSATNGNLLTSGNSYTTPILDNNATYYVSSVISSPQNAAGPVNDSLGGGSYFQYTNGHVVIFNCFIQQTLLTVDVYAQNPGNRTIQLQDSMGNVISSVTVNIPSGESTVALNIPLPVENNLMLSLSGNTYLYRNNSGANYPYTSSDGSVVLTGSDAGPDYYYYFYNWQLQQSPCVTNPVPVTVSVLTSSGDLFTTKVISNNFISFTPSNLSASTYNWNFGDDSTSSEQSPTHTYLTGGVYVVQLIESNGNCSDTITQQVSTIVITTGFNDGNIFENVALFPNPAKELLNLDISASQQLNDCKLSVYNILGETILAKNINLNTGANTFNLDVEPLTSGVYLLSLQSGKETITKRFAKVN